MGRVPNKFKSTKSREPISFCLICEQDMLCLPRKPTHSKIMNLEFLSNMVSIQGGNRWVDLKAAITGNNFKLNECLFKNCLKDKVWKFCCYRCPVIIM